MRAYFMQWSRVAILSFFAVYLYYSPVERYRIRGVCGPCARASAYGRYRSGGSENVETTRTDVSALRISSRGSAQTVSSRRYTETHDTHTSPPEPRDNPSHRL